MYANLALRRWVYTMYYSLPCVSIMKKHLLRFSINSEAFASEFMENLNRCFFDSTRLVIFSNIQPHNSVLPVS